MKTNRVLLLFASSSLESGLVQALRSLRRLAIITSVICGVLTLDRIVAADFSYTFDVFLGSLNQGEVDGLGNAARFNGSKFFGGISVDRLSGDLLISDRVACCAGMIRRVTPDGLVKSVAKISFLGQAVVSDAAGNLYFAENCAIQKLTPQGVKTTLAGSVFGCGSDDGVGSVARFSGPAGIAIDANGTIFVADSRNHTVRKILPDGTVTTFAGTAGASGSTDGLGSAARFNTPVGLDVDQQGNLYVGDVGNYTVRRISSSGDVTRFAGSTGV